jgi:hypothetical protein
MVDKSAAPHDIEQYIRVMVYRPGLGIILKLSSKTTKVSDYSRMKATGETFFKTGKL